jgi:hypothetical protein
MRTSTLSLRISKGESKALLARARKDGVSQSSVVRRALHAYGIMANSDSDKSGYDVIKHLVGTYRRGPKNISSNPKRLAGYGK